MFTFRQYRPHQKQDSIKTYPEECRAAADLLGDELKTLTFDFASVFKEPGDRLVGVQIEFKDVDGRPVWVDVIGGEPRKVLDGRPIGNHSPTGAQS